MGAKAVLWSGLLQSVFGMMFVLHLTETWEVLVSHLSYFDTQEVKQIQGVLYFLMQRQQTGRNLQ